MKKSTAVLVAVQLPDVSDEDHFASLVELGRLVHTLGFDVVGEVSQKRKAPAPGTLIGEGKLQEIAAYTGGKGVVERFKGVKAKRLEKEAAESEEDDTPEASLNTSEPGNKPKAEIVIIDAELTPTQLKNLENACGVEVLDRTGVILEIFSRHARSREARLQVEIAKLGYLAPRLRASNTGADRQGGGIGAKGAGETAHELDRRRIRDRIAELRSQLDEIHQEQGQRRTRRDEALCVALVGYTNAGKSSLMRALTGSEVLVADKLFATLDTTVRVMQPEAVPRILISDTVGFIKKLPHDLVASFRSTLDEALNASLLLFVVDASDPTFRSQLEVTQEALSQIGANDIPSRLVLNKIDRLEASDLARLKREFPDGFFMSTLAAKDVLKLKEHLSAFFEADMTDETLMVPYAKGQLVGEIRTSLKVLAESHDGEGTTFKVRGTSDAIAKIKKELKKKKASSGQ